MNGDEIKLINKTYNKFQINEVNFSTYPKMMDVRGKQIPKKMAKIDNNSSKKGILVFTGDIGNKKHEFIFENKGQTLPLEKNSIIDSSS